MEMVVFTTDCWEANSNKIFFVVTTYCCADETEFRLVQTMHTCAHTAEHILRVVCSKYYLKLSGHGVNHVIFLVSYSGEISPNLTKNYFSPSL